MFSTRLFWFEHDQSPATSEKPSEEAARAYAAQRSAEVQGGCAVLHANKQIAYYKNGVETATD